MSSAGCRRQQVECAVLRHGKFCGKVRSCAAPANPCAFVGRVRQLLCRAGLCSMQVQGCLWEELWFVLWYQVCCTHFKAILAGQHRAAPGANTAACVPVVLDAYIMLRWHGQESDALRQPQTTIAWCQPAAFAIAVVQHVKHSCPSGSRSTPVDLLCRRATGE